MDMDTDGNVETDRSGCRQNVVMDADVGCGVGMRTEGDTERDGVREGQTGSPGDRCLGPAPCRAESPETTPTVFRS